MSRRVDVHPEDLLDRMRLGVLTGDERQRLDEHMQFCEACRFESRACEDFARERAQEVCSAQVVSRIVDGAIDQASGPAPVRWVVEGKRRRWRAWGLGLAIGFAATAAVAGYLSARRIWAPARPDVAAVVSEGNGPAAHRKAAAARAEAEPIDLDDLDLEVGSEKGTSSTDPSRARAGAAPVTAADLFARANDARRHGELSDAVGLYRQLQQRFPGSREEVMARVALARLMLDRLEDPQGALALFDRYLGANPNGTLALEARLGKALALMRLGRRAEERQAWQKLLSAHPNSIYADRAERRLAELR